jgi:hypothetical protein
METVMNWRSSLFALLAVASMLSTIALLKLDAASSNRDDLAAVWANAPPEVRDLQCRDIAGPGGEDLADERFHKWYEGTMAPVTHAGMTVDQIYTQLMADCRRNQNLSVVGAVIQLRDLLEGLMPQHAGGK